MTDIDTQTPPKTDLTFATPAHDTPARGANPVLVEATRGAVVESQMLSPSPSVSVA